MMKSWIFEADVYRIRKAIGEATDDEKGLLGLRLRRAETRLRACVASERALSADQPPDGPHH